MKKVLCGLVIALMMTGSVFAELTEEESIEREECLHAVEHGKYIGTFGKSSANIFDIEKYSRPNGEYYGDLKMYVHNGKEYVYKWQVGDCTRITFSFN